jgi:UV DNA damage endonuclease
MRVRLGYVAIALGLPHTTSSGNVTYKYYQRLRAEEKINKLKQVTYANLMALKKILEYNQKKEIHFYRITSALVPLGTHPEVNWNYRPIFNVEFKMLGDLLRESKMRVDTHPDQFNVLNSLDEQIVQNTQRNLWFHVRLFQDLGYPHPKMVLHVGSAAGGKKAALERFMENFRRFPDEITTRLILENDDKSFTAKETLGLCQKLGIPMVLDVHHHLCNNEGEELKQLLPDILHTWRGEALPAKIHFSSPKDGAKEKKHTDYIDAGSFVEFLELCRHFNQDIDVMIEAKKKDLALFKLADSIRHLRKDWTWIDASTFEL